MLRLVGGRWVSTLPTLVRDMQAQSKTRKENSSMRTHASTLETPLAPNAPIASTEEPTHVALIYLVDDDEGLTDLYTIFLKGTGYAVRAFNSRTEVLEALRAEDETPDLLIMDYVGHAMPPNWFIQHCLLVEPTLRILIASGLCHSDFLCPDARPLRFLQKPFTARTFLEEVKAALAA